jgi:hypothetical protein
MAQHLLDFIKRPATVHKEGRIHVPKIVNP